MDLFNVNGYFDVIPKDITRETRKYLKAKQFPADRFPTIVTIPVKPKTTVSCSQNGLYFSTLQHDTVRSYSISDTHYCVYRTQIDSEYRILCHTVDNDGGIVVAISRIGALFLYFHNTKQAVDVHEIRSVDKALIEIDSDGNAVLIYTREHEKCWNFFVNGHREFSVGSRDVLAPWKFTHRFTVDGAQCALVAAWDMHKYVYSNVFYHDVSSGAAFNCFNQLLDCDGSLVDLDDDSYSYYSCFNDTPIHKDRPSIVPYKDIVYSAITLYGQIVIFIREP